MLSIEHWLSITPLQFFFLKIKSYHQNQQLILVVSAIASMPLTGIPVYLPHHLHLLEAFPFATNVPCLTQKPLSHKSPPKPLLPSPPSSPFKHHPPSPSSHDAIVYVLCLSLNITPPSLILVQTLTLKSPWLRSGRLNSPRLFVIYLQDLSSVAVSCEISIRVSLPGNYNDNSIKCYS